MPFGDDIGDFLKIKSAQFEKLGISRTFLLFSPYKDRNVLSAYFSLAFKGLKMPPGISKNQKRKIMGIVKEDISETPVLLIGQLAKNDTYTKYKLICGKDIVYFAFKKLLEARSIVGGRIVLVECKDAPGLRRFYEDLGFTYHGKDGYLLQYTRRIDNVYLNTLKE